MNVTLYTTHCPRCQVIAAKLDNAGIKYSTVSDVDEMIKLGIMSVPILDVDGKKLDFKEAVNWINNGGK